MKLKIMSGSSHAFTLKKYMGNPNFIFAVRKLSTGLTMWFGKKRVNIAVCDGVFENNKFVVIHNEKCMKAIRKALDGEPFGKWYIVME